MEKKFSLEQVASPERDYKTQILNVINALEKRIRVVKAEGNTHLYDKLHEKKLIDARNETSEFEPVRTDIRETFAVPNDLEHIFVHDAHLGSFDDSIKQRALRCFSVLYDVVKHEGYYGEGRTIHNFLLNKLVELVQASTEMSEDEIYDGMEADVPRFVFVKGFMSTNGFQELPEKDRLDQEHPLIDADGQPIHTAKDWFVSGNNLEDIKTIRGESKLLS